MTSYMLSCSGEIGRFYYLSCLGEFLCFLGCFCIAGRINGVYGYLEAIYSCPGVKVKPGHASMGRFRSPFRPLFFLTLQLSWASETDWLEQYQCQIRNQHLRIDYVRPAICQGHPRSSEVTDLRWPKMLKFVPGIDYRLFRSVLT